MFGLGAGRPSGLASEALVREAQIEAERIVALLRIAVSIGLIVAMFLLTGGAPEIEQPILQRQIILALGTLLSYLILGLIFYFAVRRGWLRLWMIWIAVTADCLFLLVNTWLSMVNSQVSGDLLFAMPSAWLVPLVFAFSVLRSNPWMQVFSVVLTVAGLVLLSMSVPETLTADPNQRMQTALAPVPNGMRILVIFLTGLVLIAAALRNQRLLRLSITEAQEKANLTRYLPKHLAPYLASKTTEELRRGSNEMAAVLFADVRAFTLWSEGRDPQEVSNFISEFRSRVQQAAERSNGVIDKFIGDAAMVVFVEGDAARQALQCGEDLLAEIDAWTEARRVAGDSPVHVGVGVHYGEVFAGVVGTQERLEFTVFGDTVNIAARLEALTKTSHVPLITSEPTLYAAGAEPARDGWSALPTEHLRGRSGRIALFGRGQSAERG